VLVLLAGSPLLVFIPVAQAQKSPGASWTFALYVNGDNNLDTYWYRYSLPWLEQVPASSQVNIVALVSLQSSTRSLVEQIKGGSVIIVGNYSKMDMGIPATLQWWISDSATLFPSTYYALTVWDHGSGWQYVSVDDVFGHSLSMTQLQVAIDGGSRAIDILGFDACMMANAEVAYEVAQTGKASYLVASEELVPFQGFPYNKMLTTLVNNPQMLPKDFATSMVGSWGQYYATVTFASNVNLAAIDLVQMKNTIGTFTAWSTEMLSLLPSYQSAYATALKSAYTVTNTHYFVDASNLATKLLASKGISDPNLITATKNMQSAIQTYVLSVWNSQKMTMCKGITLYWGTGTDWSRNSANYALTAFSTVTGWGNFLAQYNA